MKKIILIIIVISLYSVSGHAFFDAKAQICEKIDALKKETNISNAKIDSLIKAQVKVDAKLVGLDQSVSAGRDVINESSLMEYIIGALTGIIILMVTGGIAIIKLLFRALESKNTYKYKLKDIKENGNGGKSE